MQTGGRKPKDKHILDNIDTIREMSSKGFSEKQIAEHLGIGLSTFYKYKKTIPQFSDALISGRSKAIEDLENATFKTAMGYNYEEEKIILQLDEDGNVTKRTKEIYTKYQAGNPAQQQYLLNNWTKGEYTKDPLMAKFKEEEQKLRRETAELDRW